MTLTDSQRVLLEDKFVLWDRASRDGPTDLRDYNARAADALKAALAICSAAPGTAPPPSVGEGKTCDSTVLPTEPKASSPSPPVATSNAELLEALKLMAQDHQCGPNVWIEEERKWLHFQDYASAVLERYEALTQPQPKGDNTK